MYARRFFVVALDIAFGAIFGLIWMAGWARRFHGAEVNERGEWSEVCG